MAVLTALKSGLSAASSAQQRRTSDASCPLHPSRQFMDCWVEGPVTPVVHCIHPDSSWTVESRNQWRQLFTASVVPGVLPTVEQSWSEDGDRCRWRRRLTDVTHVLVDLCTHAALTHSADNVPLPASADTLRAAALLLLTAGRQPCSNRSTAPARQALSRKPADFNQLLEEADDQLFEWILNNSYALIDQCEYLVQH